jgi:hypothetical protein
MVSRRVVALLLLLSLHGKRCDAGRPPVSIEGMELATHQLANPVLVDVTSGMPREMHADEHHTRVPNRERQHTRAASFRLSAFGRDFHVRLRRSDYLMARRFVHVWQAPNGTLAYSDRASVDHCYYHGHIVGDPGSSVTAFTCDEGIEALLRTSSGERYLAFPPSRVTELMGNYSALQRGHKQGELPQHVVVRSSDHLTESCPRDHFKANALRETGTDIIVSLGVVRQSLPAYPNYSPTGGCTCLTSWAYTVNGVTHRFTNGQCGNPDGDANGPWCFTQNSCGIGGASSYQYCTSSTTGTDMTGPGSHSSGASELRRRLQTPSPPVAGCSHHIELLVGNDHTMYARAGNDLAAAQTHALLVANAVNTIYSTLPLGICITVVAVRTFTSVGDEGALYTSPTDSINTYLSRWSTWKGANSIAVSSAVDLRNDNAALLTNVDRSGGTVGLAWVSTICSSTQSSSVNEENSANIWQYTAETMAHEIGHNLGSNHDGSGSAANCDASAFIMAATGCSNCGFTQFKT